MINTWFPNGFKGKRHDCEVAIGPVTNPAITEGEVGLYRMNGNWDVYVLEEIRDNRIQIGTYKRTVWTG